MIRKIHLDFHTASETRDIGAAFDPDVFAQTLADAHVNMLATPGKCHYGNIYLDSKVGRPHPHLVRPDLFPATVAACAKRGIRVQAYWTLGLDAAAAVAHPEWRQRYQDGRFANWGHYLHMCFASPYIDKMVIPEVVETIARCPGLAGVWFDICLYLDGAFFSDGFEQAARTRLGDRAGDADARWYLGRQIIRERCVQLDQAIRAKLPGAENYFNTLVTPGEVQNVALQPYQEVENPILFGGPERMTEDVRWLRRHPTKVIGLVSRFQGPWSDPGTLRTPDQMRFDVARAVALGSHVSMGDHRHPDGTLEPEVYRRLAPIYAEVEACEPWLEGAKPVREAILIAEIERGAGHNLLAPQLAPSTRYYACLLEELGLQFDIVGADEEVPETDLIVWPGEKPGAEALLAQLRRHVARGGALLATDAAIDGTGDLFGVRVQPWTKPTPVAGAAASGPGTSGCGHVAGAVAGEVGPAGDFFRLRAAYGGAPFSQIMTRATRLIEALPGTEVLADRFSPISALPPFPSRTPSGAAIVQRGRVIYSTAPLFAEAMETGTPIPREVLGLLCARLLPRQRVRHTAGTAVAAHLLRSPQGYTLHLVHWAIERWDKQTNPVAEFPTLVSFEVELAIPERVQQVTLEPAGTAVQFVWKDGLCRFTVPKLKIWQVVGLHTT
jgi:hypothetical protein